MCSHPFTDDNCCQLRWAKPEVRDYRPRTQHRAVAEAIASQIRYQPIAAEDCATGWFSLGLEYLVHNFRSVNQLSFDVIETVEYAVNYNLVNCRLPRAILSTCCCCLVTCCRCLWITIPIWWNRLRSLSEMPINDRRRRSSWWFVVFITVSIFFKLILVFPVFIP